ncbi:uncharacterized protein LOC131009512 [Salvia miltiorrhiza]|uniref:uncharacterized protein LOC131009512 n=1 Tax=Salvia miltiorrhiza TaxID=226208 RepID=UPI0025AC1479|nr:uncharacterized protein LOC131009512 [Salvia miltiorrhiza]
MAFLSLLIALLSLGFTQSPAQTVEINVVLAGIVTCTNTSIANARTYAVIPQAKVEFVCGIWILERVIKSTTTSNAGIYTFAFGPKDILLNNPELCHLRVTFPSSSCSLDPPGGVLRFPIIGIRSSSSLLTEYIAGSPSYLPV